MKALGWWVLAVSCLAWAGWGVDAHAQTPKTVSPPPEAIPVASSAVQAGAIELYVGESRVLPGLHAARVAVGSGSMLTATVLDNNELLLFANAAGQSTMQVWTRGGRVLEFGITVRPTDMTRLRRELQLLFADLTTLSITSVGDKVVLDGHSLSEEQLAKVDEIGQRYPQVVNLTKFQKDRAWERMVTMDVKVVEFRNRDKVRELGIRWDEGMNGPSFGIAGDMKSSPTHGGRFLVNPPEGANFVGADALPRPLAPFRTYLGLISVLNSRIHLMEQDGDAVTLAQPQLTARSGKAAEFHVGGQIPYSVIGSLGQATVQFQNYGIIVKIKSWVDRLEQIQSDISAEFSEPDLETNPRAGVPGLRTRMAKTSFNVRTGETMVIAGLLQRRKGEAVNKVPGLASLPLVGELFKSRRSTDSDSELVVLVTPTILDLGEPGQARRHGDALLRAERYFDPPPAAPAPTP